VDLVIGVDAGGTSTRALVADGEGRVLGTGTTAGLNQRAVRDGNWKMLLEGTARLMLFDLSQDLGERNDLSASNTAVVRRLHQQLLAWEKDVDSSAKGTR